MIVLDIETSGIDISKNGIWQIGAINTETGEEFLQECRLDGEDEVMKEALEIVGKKEEDLRQGKQSQKELLEEFFKWLEKVDKRIIAGQAIGFDIMFIETKCLKYGLRDEFDKFLGHRGFELSTLAQILYKIKNGKFKIKDGKNGMGLSDILKMFNVKDERRKNNNGKITEGKPHNALEDCKLEAGCFEKIFKKLK